jgi:hypothetical protein
VFYSIFDDLRRMKTAGERVKTRQKELEEEEAA